MKYQRLLFVAALSIVCAGIFIACSKSNSDNGGGTNPGGSGDATLANIGNNIIVSSYQNLSTAATAFDAAVTAFNAGPTTGGLSDLQAKFAVVYKAWETCSEFEFGPGSEQTLITTTVNVFPTDTVLINANVSSGSYTIDGISNLKAQGFPAIDFLLFGSDNTSVLTRFTTGSKAANAKQYLAAVTSSIKTKAGAVVNAWLGTGGNYINKFITNTGVNSGSSLSLLVNALVHDYDVVLKNYKIGIPFGKYGPNTIPQDPTKVEAYYSGSSLQLLVLQVQAIQNIYTGGTGLGLDDKIAATSAQSNGQPLNTVITSQLATVIAKLQAIPAPLSGAIQSNSTTVADAYTEVQKLVVLLKVDMCSALGVKIAFQDDDGD